MHDPDDNQAYHRTAAPHDGVWRCADRGCGVCAVWPRAGESQADFLARVGALYRAAPAVTRARPRPVQRLTCAWCGEEYAWLVCGETPRFCGRACKAQAYRARKRAG